MSSIQEQPTEGVCRENGQIRPSTKRSGYRGASSGRHLASVLQEGRENANIDAGLGFIWRISVKSTGGGREPLTQLDAVSQFWSDQSEADMPRTRSGV
jgi:hypothetical protein